MPSSELLAALGVTAELTGTQLSKAAATVMAQDLSAYPENQVLGALTRCRKELRGKLTIADIITRLDDGRPQPEQAWALVSRSLTDESITIIWTPEIATAFGVALNLSDDPIAARMAFKESYAQECQKARDSGTPVIWMPSLGTDWRGREAPLLEAVNTGKLTAKHALALIPGSDTPSTQVKALMNKMHLGLLRPPDPNP